MMGQTLMDYQVCSFFGATKLSLPEKDTACKFVLVKNHKTVWLVFGPISKYRYHAHLVEGLCSHLGIASVWAKKPDLINVIDKEVEIMGGGILSFDSKEDTIKLGGVSRAYGGFDRRELQNLVKSHSLFDDISIEVGM